MKEEKYDRYLTQDEKDWALTLGCITFLRGLVAVLIVVIAVIVSSLMM